MRTPSNVPSSESVGTDIRGLAVYYDVIDEGLSERIRADMMRTDRHHASEILVEDERRVAPRLTSSYSDLPLSLDGMDTSRPWSTELAELRDTVAQRFGLTFNYALGNLYRDGVDFTGWHCDKAWLHEPDSIIAIASFGATRTLAVRRLDKVGEVRRIALPDSSVALMDLSLQATHEHCIVAESDDVGKRLSITLRRIKILPEYLDGSRQRRRRDGVSPPERNQANAVHG